MMELDTQSVLIGALLIEDKLAPYAGRLCDRHIHL